MYVSGTHLSEGLGQLLLLFLLQPPPLKLINDREVDGSAIRRGRPLHQGTGLPPLLVLEHPHV